MAVAGGEWGRLTIRWSPSPHRGTWGQSQRRRDRAGAIQTVTHNIKMVIANFYNSDFTSFTHNVQHADFSKADLQEKGHQDRFEQIKSKTSFCTKTRKIDPSFPFLKNKNNFLHIIFACFQKKSSKNHEN